MDLQPSSQDSARLCWLWGGGGGGGINWEVLVKKRDGAAYTGQANLPNLARPLVRRRDDFIAVEFL